MWFFVYLLLFCFQKQLGDSITDTIKEKAANVGYLSFVKEKICLLFKFGSLKLSLLDVGMGERKESRTNS